MKKLLSILLAAMMLLSAVSFVSCGDEPAGSNGGSAVKVIDIALTSEEYAYAVKKGNAELLDSLNTFLAEIQGNGKFDEIMNKYFGDGTPTPIVSAVKDDSKDQLIVATNLGFEPFEYKDGENALGVDMEIMKLFADSLGKELVIDNMEFESVCTAVAQGMCDIAAAGLTITDVRKETLDFSTPYYSAAQMLIVKGDDTAFDACTTKEDVEKLLNAMTADTKIGVQTGTTGHYYVTGSEDWGFAGFPVTCVPYETGALAVQNILNGNVKYVVIDEAPAKAIAKNINAVN